MAVATRASNKSRARNRVIGVFLALGLIVFVCVMTSLSSAENRKVVTVARIKQNNPISANAIITESMIEAYDMYYKEFKNYGTLKFSDGTTRGTIVRWEDRGLVVGVRYAAYYMRGGTLLFWDATLKDQTRKNSYLYSMSGELLNIKLSTTQDFGDMVVPGDSLNIRATYTKVNYNLPSEEQYKLALDSGLSSNTVDTVVIEPLFSEVQILDMLNSSGNSIFDIYYEYISMTKAEQSNCLESTDFLNSVKPASILIECTSEEVEHYMTMQSAGASYQMTLLPRKSSSSITDSLSDIQEALAGIAGLSK